jgi:hypothetical protein
MNFNLTEEDKSSIKELENWESYYPNNDLWNVHRYRENYVLTFGGVSDNHTIQITGADNVVGFLSSKKNKSDNY